MMTEIGTSLVVQRLRLQASKSGGLSAIPDQATRSHIPLPQCSQISKCYKLKKPENKTEPVNTTISIVTLTVHGLSKSKKKNQKLSDWIKRFSDMPST